MAAIGIHPPEIVSAFALGDEDDVTAIRRDTGHKIHVIIYGQLSLMIAICVHNPDIRITAGGRAINDAAIGRPSHAQPLAKEVAETRSDLCRTFRRSARRHKDVRNSGGLDGGERARIGGETDAAIAA